MGLNIMLMDEEIFRELAREIALASVVGGKFIRQLIVSDLIKPTTKVYIYKESNHKTPHLHVYFGKEQSVSINIETSEMLAGEMDSKLQRKVKDWVTKNREQLLDNWHSIQNGELPEISWESNA